MLATLWEELSHSEEAEQKGGQDKHARHEPNQEGCCVHNDGKQNTRTILWAPMLREDPMSEQPDATEHPMTYEEAREMLGVPRGALPSEVQFAYNVLKVKIGPLRHTEPEEHKLLCEELDEALRLVEFAGGVSIWVDWDEVLREASGGRRA